MKDRRVYIVRTERADVWSEVKVRGFGPAMVLAAQAVESRSPKRAVRLLTVSVLTARRQPLAGWDFEGGWWANGKV